MIISVTSLAFLIESEPECLTTNICIDSFYINYGIAIFIGLVLPSIIGLIIALYLLRHFKRTNKIKPNLKGRITVALIISAIAIAVYFPINWQQSARDWHSGLINLEVYLAIIIIISFFIAFNLHKIIFAHYNKLSIIKKRALLITSAVSLILVIIYNYGYELLFG